MTQERKEDLAQQIEAEEAMKHLLTLEQAKAMVKRDKEIYQQWVKNPRDPALNYWFQYMKKEGWTKKEMKRRLGGKE